MPAVTQHKVKGQQNRAFPGLIVPDQNVTVMSEAQVQFRISEALCVLPYFLPSAVPGVTIGCFLANLLCGAAPLDVVFGSLATLIGAVGSYYLGKKSKWLVCVPPILANTIIIPWVLRYAYGSTDLIPYAMVTVGIGEILAIGVLGNILLLALERSHRAVFAQ